MMKKYITIIKFKRSKVLMNNLKWIKIFIYLRTKILKLKKMFLIMNLNIKKNKKNQKYNIR